MNQVIDFSTLTWVKKELDDTLKEARQALEAHVENPQDEAQPGFLAAHLHQVYGTLQMVELYGASLLAEEMEKVARAIADQSVTRREDACEALMGAMLQLPDYLDRLISGYRDIPLVLLPVLNDLRAVRGENLLSENSMFAPDLGAALPDHLLQAQPEGDVARQAREYRHRFQRGLLGLFRNKDTKDSLDALQQVLDGLQRLGGDAPVVRLWWVAAGVLDALRAGALGDSIALKRVLGQLDREIKRLGDNDEAASVEAGDARDDLFKNLLFYCAQSPAATSTRIAEIRETYRLGELLPDEAELAAARESLSGQNSDLFETVAVAVKEELARLKDSLDIVLRNGCRNTGDLEPLIAALRSLGDTLGMLSLGAARMAVVGKADELQTYVASGDAPADTVLMNVASTLLYVESSVDGMGCGRAVASSDTPVEEHLAQSEYQQVMDVVIQEAIADLRRGKEAIVSYTDSDHDASHLDEVPQWFNQVKGGLLLLGETRSAALVESISRYVATALIDQQKQASQEELDSLADAVCGLEYYLESRKDHRMYGGSAIAAAEQGIGRLGYPAEEAAGPAESGASEGAGEASPPLAEFDGDSTVTAVNDEQPNIEPAPEEAGFEFDFSLLDESPVVDAHDAGTPADAEAPDTELSFDVSEIEAVGESYDTDAAANETIDTVPAENELPEERPVDAAAIASESENAEDDDGLAIIGEDVDDEILEIFIEEAEEELASMHEQLPVWLANSESSESLASIRRSYHTLKGSGRLVGAMRIGEFAWAFENMLNRLMDGTISVSPAMTELLQSAMLALSELVAQIKDGAPTGQPIGHLMRCAEALSQGEALPDATPGPRVSGEPDPGVVEADAEPDSDESGIELALELDTTTLPIDAEATGDEDREEDPGSLSYVAELPDSGSLLVSTDSVMDPLLYEIFSTESRAHLEVVRQFLGGAVAGETQVDELLARALHTMHGSAHMAEADAIAKLAGELEKLLKTLLGFGRPVTDDVCQVLEDGVVIIEAMLSSLPAETTVPERYDATIEWVREQCAAISVAERRDASPESLQHGDAALDESEEVPEALAEAGDLPEAIVEADEFSEAVAEADELPDAIGEPDDLSDAVAVVEDEASREEPVDDTMADCYAGHDQELLEIFLDEGAENLETSDAALHRWREASTDSEALAELQRALHTLKGGARMAELAAVGDVAHAVEALIISISEGRCGVGDAAIEAVQRAQDRLSDMLDQVRSRRPLQAADELVAELDAIRAQGPDETMPDGEAADDTPEVEPAQRRDVAGEVAAGAGDPYAETDPELLEVFIEEASDIVEHTEQTLQRWKRAPSDRTVMADLQRELHTLKGGARMADITEIGDLAHAVESLMVKVTEGDLGCSEAMFGVLERAQDTLAGMVEQVRSHRPLESADGIVAALEALREGQELPAAIAEKKVSAQKPAKAAAESDAELEERRSRSRNGQELVRVKADLLDNLVNHAGEVSIYRSRLEQQVGAYSFNLVEMEQTVARVREQLRKLEIETEAQVIYRYEREGELIDAAADGEDFDPLEMDRYSHMQQLSRSLMESVSDLSSIQNMLENITRESETLLLQQSRVNTELQEGLMRTRMVPFLGLSARMRRIVRQTAQEVGKKAELELSGAEGEMDRTVVDRIIAPIEHMLRNAISHGIETPQQRLEKGKPETGTIKITLERESSDVVLRIADDGAGISLKAIRKKAIERGLMQADSDLTDNEVLQFILETGFSTAEKVTQVAGRGVGMDVVNSEVKQLGGSLHIDSEYNRGTIFTIRLPFTLALNQALLIEVGEDTYAIPLSSIEGIVRMRREDLKAHYEDPESRFEYGGYAYEVRHLGTVLATGAPHLDSGPKRVPVLLARVGEHCVAFHVENLLGSREIVVKSVGPQISTVRGVSGATILGDGRVVMILDVAALLRGGGSALDQVNDIISQPVRTQGLTVMVVDDSITVRKVTTRLLERNDMNVIAAKDGVDAVSKLQENIPDIMLLDIEMPRMDGFELATHVRNEPRLRDIPIIMITSRTGDKHRQRAMQIGVNRYLGKPFQESELLENIQALLEETRLDG